MSPSPRSKSLIQIWQLIGLHRNMWTFLWILPLLAALFGLLQGLADPYEGYRFEPLIPPPQLFAITLWLAAIGQAFVLRGGADPIGVGSRYLVLLLPIRGTMVFFAGFLTQVLVLAIVILFYTGTVVITLTAAGRLDLLPSTAKVLSGLSAFSLPLAIIAAAGTLTAIVERLTPPVIKVLGRSVGATILSIVPMLGVPAVLAIMSIFWVRVLGVSPIPPPTLTCLNSRLQPACPFDVAGIVTAAVMIPALLWVSGRLWDGGAEVQGLATQETGWASAHRERPWRANAYEPYASRSRGAGFSQLFHVEFRASAYWWVALVFPIVAVDATRLFMRLFSGGYFARELIPSDLILGLFLLAIIAFVMGIESIWRDRYSGWQRMLQTLPVLGRTAISARLSAIWVKLALGIPVVAITQWILFSVNGSIRLEQFSFAIWEALAPLSAVTAVLALFLSAMGVAAGVASAILSTTRAKFLLRPWLLTPLAIPVLFAGSTGLSLLSSTCEASNMLACLGDILAVLGPVGLVLTVGLATIAAMLWDRRLEV